MAEPHRPDEFDDSDAIPGLNDRPYGEESAEQDDDQPRRAASARFVVDAQVGSEAAMRDAMDPANQSLADALRLSFRVLQSVMIVLIVLFLVSGFQTVDEGQSGVRTVWGKIVTADGAEALTPGPKFSIYPYPIGEFVLFPDGNRTVELKSIFAPAQRAPTQAQMLESATVDTPLQPGPRGDGSLLTRDGDLVHMELSARYAIEQAGPFVRRVNDDDRDRNADRLVTLALQRAAIRVAAMSSLQELTDQTDDVRLQIAQLAQEALDALECGISLTQVQVQRAYAPLAIEKAMGDLQAARVDAAEMIERARQKANETLNNIAGSDYPELLALIERYEDPEERGDDTGTSEMLVAVRQRLEASSGEVSQIVQSAKAYQTQIESTLGNEYRRFASLLPAYHQNPNLLMRQQWLDAYAQVISKPDAEMIYVDPLMSMSMSITGNASIQELRRRNLIERREREAAMTGFDRDYYYLRGRDINIGKPGRMLQIKDGRAVAPGSQ